VLCWWTGSSTRTLSTPFGTSWDPGPITSPWPQKNRHPHPRPPYWLPWMENEFENKYAQQKFSHKLSFILTLGTGAAEGGPEYQQYSLQVHYQEWNLEHEGGVNVVVRQETTSLYKAIICAKTTVHRVPYQGGGNLSGNFPPLNAEKISDWPETGESRREEKVDVKTSL